MAADQGMLLASTLQGSSAVSEPTYTRRKGVVTDYDTSDGTATVKIGGDPNTVSGIGSFSNYTPRIGDVVWLDVHGNDTPRIVDRVGNVGPSVFAAAQLAAVVTNESRGATGYGDLATPGPSLQVTVSGSGMLLVVISCEISVTSDNDGGAVGVALSGANTVAASDSKAIKFFPGFNTALAQMSRTLLYTNLNPGDTTVTMKYHDLFDAGTDVFYANRELIALPM